MLYLEWCSLYLLPGMLTTVGTVGPVYDCGRYLQQQGLDDVTSLITDVCK